MFTTLNLCQYVLFFIIMVMWLFITYVGFGEKYKTIQTINKKYDYCLFASIINSIIFIVFMKIVGL